MTGDAVHPGSPTDPGAPLRLSIVPGVTVSKWTRTWAERHPDRPLQVVPTPESAQVRVLHDGGADVGFVRLPVDRTGLSVIPLYEEVAVVVLPVDHELTLLEEVTTADLAAERTVQEADVATAVALVAAGLGVVVVPQSVARHHHRKDLTYRPVTDVEPTRIALAWRVDRTTAAVEDLIGIVRGRTVNSSRGQPTAPVGASDAAPTKAPGGAPGRLGGQSGGRSAARSSGRSTGRARGRRPGGRW